MKTVRQSRSSGFSRPATVLLGLPVLVFLGWSLGAPDEPQSAVLAMAFFGATGRKPTTGRVADPSALSPAQDSESFDREEFARVERLAAAEALAGEVAHAINNPLAVLLGRLQMRI